MFTPSVEPADAVITMTSDDEYVLIVSNTGRIAPISTGSATITVSITVDGKEFTAQCLCNVQDSSTNYFTTSSDGSILNRYSGSDNEIIIPVTINGLPVKEIQTYTFNRLTLEKIIIPEGVTTIGSYAFNNCSDLTMVVIPSSVATIEQPNLLYCHNLNAVYISDANTVYKSIDGAIYNKAGTELIRCPQGKTGTFTIPDGVTAIGESAFYDCTGLIEINIPSSVITIGDSAFARCTGLIEINIPSSVITIGDSAFARCTGLTKVIIPSGVTTIGESAFQGCAGLTEIDIPSGVTTIGDRAFDGCSGLTEIDIPSGVTTISDRVFYGCTSLTAINVDSANTIYQSINGVVLNKQGTEVIFCPRGKVDTFIIPDGVTIIGESAFYDCTGLTQINIPSGVITIGDYAFYNCTGLTQINIPSSVQTIGESALYFCSGLTEINIPSDVTTISDSLFYGCTSLTDINVDSANTIYQSINGVVLNKQGTELIFCPRSKVGTFIIPDGVKIIGQSAFQGCAGLTEINIPSGVTSIPYGAFSGCTELTTIVIPSTVTSLGCASFRNCTNLSSISLSPGLTEIQEDTFWGCSSLTEITIPFGVTKIGKYAFWCSGLSNITIPASVVSLEICAFGGCDNLNTVFIPASVTEFYDPFNQCENIIAIEFDEANTVFKDIDGVVFDKAGTEIIFFPYGKGGAYTIPDGVTTIRYYLFYNHKNLYSVTLPASLTTIGSDAFFCCEDLEEIKVDRIRQINRIFSISQT